MDNFQFSPYRVALTHHSDGNRRLYCASVCFVRIGYQGSEHDKLLRGFCHDDPRVAVARALDWILGLRYEVDVYTENGELMARLGIAWKRRPKLVDITDPRRYVFRVWHCETSDVVQASNNAGERQDEYLRQLTAAADHYRALHNLPKRTFGTKPVRTLKTRWCCLLHALWIGGD